VLSILDRGLLVMGFASLQVGCTAKAQEAPQELSILIYQETER
jgi:hypothetical protein